MKMPRIRASSGSIPGWHNLQKQRVLKGTNNQDAYRLTNTPELLLGVVCDGCGSQALSEIGANAGADLFTASIQKLWKRFSKSAEKENWDKLSTNLLEEARKDVLASIRTRVNEELPSFGVPSFTSFLKERYLFLSLIHI